MRVEAMLGYIDPGSGTILLQLVLASLVGGVAFLGKSLWSLVTRGSFRRRAPDRPAFGVVGGQDEAGAPQPERRAA